MLTNILEDSNPNRSPNKTTKARGKNNQTQPKYPVNQQENTHTQRPQPQGTFLDSSQCSTKEPSQGTYTSAIIRKLG